MTKSQCAGAFIGLLMAASIADAQQPAPPPSVTRTEVLKQALPAGDYRTVEAVVIELAPGAGAPVHRHDVAVVAYVLEGVVENRFNGGPLQTHRVGESWWEAPGTVHEVARNASTTARARLLVVYIIEPGKAPTVRIDSTRPPDR